MSDIYVEFNANAAGEVAAIQAVSVVTGTHLNVTVASNITQAASVVVGTIILTATITGAVVAASYVTGTFNREGSKTNWVAWSKIGEAKIEMDRTNDSGAAPMRWNGTVYQVMELDKNIVVYGSGGITKMMPVSSPAPTFGFKELASFGVKARGLVAGDKYTHYFVSETGALYRITEAAGYQELKLERLGYEEFLGSLDDDARMFFSPNDGKLYISDGSVGYTLSEQGMGGGWANLTGMQHSADGRLFIRPSELTNTIELTTNILDLGIRDVKTLNRLVLRADHPEHFSYAVEYRYNPAAGWNQTEWSIFDPYGEGYPWVSGGEFRIKLLCETPPEAVEIQDLLIGFQLSDHSLKGMSQ